MTTPDLLRAVADKLEAYVIPAEHERVLRLMALHMGRVTGDPFFAEEARLLCEMLGSVNTVYTASHQPTDKEPRSA